MEFHAGGDLLSLIQRMGNRLEETAVRFYTAEVRINFLFIVLRTNLLIGHSSGSGFSPEPDCISLLYTVLILREISMRNQKTETLLLDTRKLQNCSHRCF
jgi:hypothetical protein